MDNKVKNRIFGLLIVTFALALLEFFSYIYVYKVKDNPLGAVSERHLYSYFRGHELNPEYRRPFDTGDVRIHSDDGFRSDHSFSIDKPKDVFRVILFGGSQAYGVGSQPGGVYPENRSLSNDQTVSNFLEANLNTIGKEQGRSTRVEIINAAVVAYKTYQHLLYFNERLYMYDADLLLFVDGHNDYYSDEISRNPMLKNAYAKELVWNFNNRSFAFSIYSFFRGLGEYSYFFKFLEKTMQKLLPIISPYESPVETEAIHDVSRYEEYANNSYLRIYRQFAALQSQYGYGMHIVIQPQLLFENEQLLSEHDKKIYAITDKYSDKQLMQEIKKKLPSVFNQANLAFTDLTTIAEGSNNGLDLYYDYTHLTPAGSKLSAVKISSAIQHKVFPPVE